MYIVETPVFRVPAGSATEQAIKAYVQAKSDAVDAWVAFADRHGADRMWYSSTLDGLIFDEGKPPAGWVQCKGLAIAYRPSLKGPLSNAAREYKALPQCPDNVQWLKSLGLDIHISGRGYKTPGFVRFSETYYLTADPGCPIPDEVIEVNGSVRTAVLEYQGGNHE